MNQYIITGEQIRRYKLDSYIVPDSLEVTAGEEVRSHPYNPQAERELWCGDCGFKESETCNDETTWKRCRLMSSEPEGKNVEARLELARQSAREKVLKEISARVKNVRRCNSDIGENNILDWVIGLCKELRQEGKQEQP